MHVCLFSSGSVARSNQHGDPHATLAVSCAAGNVYLYDCDAIRCVHLPTISSHSPHNLPAPRQRSPSLALPHSRPPSLTLSRTLSRAPPLASAFARLPSPPPFALSLRHSRDGDHAIRRYGRFRLPSGPATSMVAWHDPVGHRRLATANKDGALEVWKVELFEDLACRNESGLGHMVPPRSVLTSALGRCLAVLSPPLFEPSLVWHSILARLLRSASRTPTRAR